MPGAVLEWLADLGDPDPFSWMVTAGYLVAALLCWRAGRANGDERSLWRCLALFLLLGGLNKQLDLQTLMIVLARAALTGTRWFADRRMAQAGFVAVLALATIATGLWLFHRARRWRGPARIACSGAAMIALFWLSRAGAISHLAGREPADHGGLLQALEVIGVAMAASGALLEGRCAIALREAGHETAPPDRSGRGQF